MPPTTTKNMFRSCFPLVKVQKWFISCFYCVLRFFNGVLELILGYDSVFKGFIGVFGVLKDVFIVFWGDLKCSGVCFLSCKW